MGKPYFGVPSVSGVSHGVLSAKWGGGDPQCPVYTWSEPQCLPASGWLPCLMGLQGGVREVRALTLRDDSVLPWRKVPPLPYTEAWKGHWTLNFPYLRKKRPRIVF